MSEENEQLNVELVEKELIQVELVEKELLRTDLNVIDILDYYERSVSTDLVMEVPAQLTATQFQTSLPYTFGTLIVFFNGLKEKYITQIDSTTFEFGIDIIGSDIIEVIYVKQT